MTGRTLAFVALTAGCLIVAVAAVGSAALKSRGEDQKAEQAAAKDRPSVSRLVSGSQPFVLLRSLDRQNPANYGRLAIAPLDRDQPGSPLIVGEECERVDLAAGRGLCLGPAGPTGFNAKLLDSSLHVTKSVRLVGVPSRTRISPDGRFGGVTSFVAGHSYADVGQFSTGTSIIDLRSGDKIGDLEKDFTFSLHGHPVTARDRNFWGLTFSRDGDTFYATMSTGGKTYLVKGSLKHRTGRAIHENVECPSLSPDETRIAYKKNVGDNPPVWHFYVLDLATGRETPLAESRPLDDQIEWLDNTHVLYKSGEATWVMPADGSGTPQRWLAAADSPSIVRG